jgi:hypothetical protein
MEEYRFLNGIQSQVQDELNHLKDFYHIEVISMVKYDVVVTLLLKLKQFAE